MLVRGKTGALSQPVLDALTRLSLQPPLVLFISPWPSFDYYLLQRGHGDPLRALGPALDKTWSAYKSHLACVTENCSALRLHTSCPCACHRECGVGTRAMNSNSIPDDALRILIDERTISVGASKGILAPARSFRMHALLDPDNRHSRFSGTVRICTLESHVQFVVTALALFNITGWCLQRSCFKIVASPEGPSRDDHIC
jgi:hypothetical protein